MRHLLRLNQLGCVRKNNVMYIYNYIGFFLLRIFMFEQLILDIISCAESVTAVFELKESIL